MEPTGNEGVLGTRRVAQIGFVVRDAAAKAATWAALFGVPMPEIRTTDDPALAGTRFQGAPTEGGAKLAFFKLENIEIELIEPVGGPSTWQHHLDTYGEGVHHLGFWVEEMEKRVADCVAAGAPLEQSGGWDGGCYRYLDGRQAFGTVLELLTLTK